MILFVPWNTTVVPPVRVQVFDESGKPAPGIGVEQEWQYQAIGSEPQRAILTTGADGYIALPKRTVRILSRGKHSASQEALYPRCAQMASDLPEAFRLMGRILGRRILPFVMQTILRRDPLS